MEWPDREGWFRLLVTFVSLTVYLALIEPLGVAVASFLFSTFLIWYLDRRFVRSICVGAAVALVIQFVFVRILQLSFPAGFWAVSLTGPIAFPEAVMFFSWDLLIQGFGSALAPVNLFWALVGCLIGTLVGVCRGSAPHPPLRS